MKKTIYLSLIFGAFLFVSCKETPKSQKVVLVQGNFKYDKAKSTLTTSFKGKDLIIPIDSLLSSTVLSQDSVKGTLQVSMLLKDNGVFLAPCDENCNHFTSIFSSINPPGCPLEQCSGLSFIHFALDPNPEALLPAFQFENSQIGINQR